MPFFVLNAVLALISIVGGLSLYTELENTRRTLRITEQQVLAADVEIKICKDKANEMIAQRNAAFQVVLRQNDQLQKFRDTLTRHRIEWHEEPGIVLEIAPP
jgi:hypothetical protein